MIAKQLCTGCTACKHICPKHCISMREDIEGFKYPVVNAENCIHCNLCEKVCPIDKCSKLSSATYCIFSQNKSEDIRSISSAGGIVGAILKKIFDMGGVAFGTGYEADNIVKYYLLESMEECKQYHIFSSKYVASEIDDIFPLVLEKLKENRQVCFVGLPCHVAGLKSFLQKEYENLFLIDLTCYGVPSPKVFRMYLEHCEKKYKSKIKEINFRDKIFGYVSPTMTLSFSDGKKRSQNSCVKSYLRTFFSNINIRPSCFNCKFKTVERESDITVGDFRSIGKFIPEMDDDLGTTVIYIHTDYGKEIVSSIDTLNSMPIDLDKVINTSGRKMIERPSENIERSSFFRDINKMEYGQLIDKYCPASANEKIINCIKGLLLITNLNKSKILKKIKKF